MHFVTNLVQSSTATNCKGWLEYTSTPTDNYKPNILYTDSNNAGNKHFSFTFFDNLHPEYMVIDGDMKTYFYESSSVDE